MKKILIALVILQLALVSKGGPSKKPQKCPRNPKLEALKKLVRQSLARGGSKGFNNNLEKRNLFGDEEHQVFPIHSCAPFAYVKLFNGAMIFYLPLMECCGDCEHKFFGCLNPQDSHAFYKCTSKAFACLFACRVKHLEKLKPKKGKHAKVNRICKKTTCHYDRPEPCCVKENQCVTLKELH